MPTSPQTHRRIALQASERELTINVNHSGDDNDNVWLFMRKKSHKGFATKTWVRTMSCLCGVMYRSFFFIPLTFTLNLGIFEKAKSSLWLTSGAM